MLNRLVFALAAAALSLAPAHAADTVKIGFIAPMTGQFSQIGAKMIAGAKYFLAEAVAAPPARGSSC